MAIDMVGQRIGRLVVLNYARPPGLWNVRCDCGTEKVIRGTGLRGKRPTKSCGCLDSETTIARNLRHGEANKTPEYQAWLDMKKRCFNEDNKNYKDYGARGITVCDRWRDDFEAFLADVGRRPSDQHSIDRYPNNDGNYEPKNCRWATRSEQMNNTRASRARAALVASAHPLPR